MILECKMNQAYPKLDLKAIDLVIASGDLPYCDYQWVLDLREQCIFQHCLFFFESTGPILIKDQKSYSIQKLYKKNKRKKPILITFHIKVYFNVWHNQNSVPLLL